MEQDVLRGKRIELLDDQVNLQLVLDGGGRITLG